MGCSRTYAFPPLLHSDVGEPRGLCRETAPHSGVFRREWSHATVQMDCNTWTPTIDVREREEILDVEA